MRFRNTFIFVALLIFCAAGNIFAQSQILQHTHVAALEQLSRDFHSRHLLQRAAAEEWAREHNAPIRRSLPDGSLIEIQALVHGRPVYYLTQNLDAAKTVSANLIWSGGSAGLELSGAGIKIGEWDGGGVLTTHQELTGRVTQKDSPGSTHYHSTHVAGTMIAAGISNRAKGMAYQATLDAYDWTDDESEAAAAGATGLLFSNHSYSYITGWRYNFFNDSRYAWFGDPAISETEDYWFGFYSGSTLDWDQIAWDAPYYLIVASAGNDRNDSGPSAGAQHWVYEGNDWVLSTVTRDADGGADGYDCIPAGRAISKNSLTVGAVSDITNGYTSPSDVHISSFSSWGPADDGRIKPDITGNGVSLYSCSNSSNLAYLTVSGTSMSSPNVTGSLALLQQHFQNTHQGESMRAATLKALVIHTADEAGAADGPDYAYGWGLLNAKSAADVITEDTAEPDIMLELTLSQNVLFIKKVYSAGTAPIRLTIVWTDPPAASPSDQLNPRTPMLVNDLDLRIVRDSDSQEFFPWHLDVENPAVAATQADNTIDNVEQVLVENPQPGNYTITVNHKGSLQHSEQDFSIIISGLEMTLECLPPSLAVQDTSALPESDVEIMVELDGNLTPVDAFGFKFNYDTTKFSYLGTEKGELIQDFSFFQAVENIAGEVTIGGFHTTVLPANSKGNFVKVKLHVNQCEEGVVSEFTLTDLADDLVGLNSCSGRFTCGPTCQLGDLNLDERITPEDAWCVFQVYLNGGIPPDGPCNNLCTIITADANCDEAITPDDALIVFQGYMNSLLPPLECPTAQFALAKKAIPRVLYLPEVAGKAGQIVTFSILVEQPQELQAFGFDLGYPKNAMSFISAERAELTTHWQALEARENVAGVVTIGGFNAVAITDSTAGPLVTLKFKVKENTALDGEIWLFNLKDDLANSRIQYHSNRLLSKEERPLENAELPDEFSVAQNFPNPFNAQTKIVYHLPGQSLVEIDIYNSLGQKIRTLISRSQSAGKYEVHWNSRDESGREVPSGIYFYRLQASDFSEMKKMLLIK